MFLRRKILGFMSLTITALLPTHAVTTPNVDGQSIPHSSHNRQRFVPWSNTDNDHSSALYLLDIKVNNLPVTMPVDTGSTGILFSAITLNHDPSSLEHYEPGFEYLSSSKRYYSGYMLPSNLTFTSLEHTVLVSRVDILAVTERGHCLSFVDGVCEKTDVEHMPDGIRYMGVGFGRWSKEQPYARANRNPLLNVEFDDEEEEETKSGYIISQTGVVLGITQQDMEESQSWNFTKLSKNVGATGVSSEDRPEWNGTPMCIQLAGSPCFSGTALFDTGLNYSFVGVPKPATKDLTTRIDGRTVFIDGTEVVVRVGTSKNPIANYSFRVGDLDQDEHVTPAQVRLVKEHADGSFINTGRFFFNGFDLLFEELSGTVGLRHQSIGVALQRENESEEMEVREEL